MLVQKAYSSLARLDDLQKKYDRALANLETAREGWRLARKSNIDLEASNRYKIELQEKEIETLKKSLENTKLNLKNEKSQSAVFLQNQERVEKNYKERQESLDLSLRRVEELTNSQDELRRDNEEALRFKDQALQAAQDEIETLKNEVQRYQDDKVAALQKELAKTNKEIKQQARLRAYNVVKLLLVNNANLELDYFFLPIEYLESIEEWWNEELQIFWSLKKMSQ